MNNRPSAIGAQAAAESFISFICVLPHTHEDFA
jgi:hypothetical protein